MEGRGWGVTEKRITEMKESGKAAKTPPSLTGGLFPWGNEEALVASLKLFTSLTDLPRWSKGSSHTNKAAAHPREQHTLATAVCPRQGHEWAQKTTDSKETESKQNIQEKEWQVKQNPLGFSDRLKWGISRYLGSSQKHHVLTAFWILSCINLKLAETR